MIYVSSAFSFMLEIKKGNALSVEVIVGWFVLVEIWDTLLSRSIVLKSPLGMKACSICLYCLLNVGVNQ